jgi:hypothetical protein
VNALPNKCEACGETKHYTYNSDFRKFGCGAAYNASTGNWTHSCRHYQKTIDELRSEVVRLKERLIPLVETEEQRVDRICGDCGNRGCVGYVGPDNDLCRACSLLEDEHVGQRAD